MSGKITNLAAAVALLLVQACAGRAPEAKNPISARFADRGVSPAALSVKSDSQLAFVNEDGRPHQIYSSDCGELSTTVLAPGQSTIATLGPGPKICHYQDLLAPGAEQYWGTVSVGATRTRSEVWFNPGAGY